MVWDMSDEERFVIIGRMTSELAEAKRKAAFASRQMEEFVQALEAILRLVRARTGAAHIQSRVPFPAAVTDYADLSKLRALVQEQDAALARTEELERKLAELGI
jgi:histone acetyltransferase (RNA polymerase elongator complex component)